MKKRLILTICLPVLWCAVLYVSQRPADTRAREGVEISMDEPLGSWSHDQALHRHFAPQVAALPTPATGTQVYQLRMRYFRRFMALQALYMLGAVLAVIGIHDVADRYFSHRKGKG